VCAGLVGGVHHYRKRSEENGLPNVIEAPVAGAAFTGTPVAYTPFDTLPFTRSAMVFATISNSTLSTAAICRATIFAAPLRLRNGCDGRRSNVLPIVTVLGC
jgi:hypothetical protein